MNTTILYSLTDPDGNVKYIGKTTAMTLNGRLSKHMADVRKGCNTKKCKWIRSLLNEGKLPSINKLEVVQGDGCTREIELIAEYKTKGVKLKNSTFGGQGTLGRKVPQSTRDAVSLAHKGIPLTEEHKRKISIGGRGKIISEETRQRISTARKNSPLAQAHAIAQKGRVFSDEHRKKISDGVRRSINAKKQYD